MENGIVRDPFREPGDPVSGNQGGGNIIIPFIHNPHLYHLYVVYSNDYGEWFGGDSGALVHRTIDMRLNGGLGEVLEPISSFKKTVFKGNANQLTCALHANGKDTWLIGRKRDTDTLIAWLVSDTGFSKTVYSKTNSPVRKPNIIPASILIVLNDAQIKTSPDSRMLIVPRRTNEFPFHELYRFNNETGIFSGPIYIKDSTNSNPDFFVNGFPDACFSPDSRKLYTSLGTRKKQSGTTQTDTAKGTFWQFDVSSYDSILIAQSKRFLGRMPKLPPNRWVPAFAPSMQIAMNGKIYISPGSFSSVDTFLSVINCPNSAGLACGIEWRKHSLPSSNGAYFPTLNQTLVRNAGIFQLQANKRKLCQGDTLELSGYGAGAEHFSWTVSPALPVSVKVDTLTWQKIGTKNIPPSSYTFTCQSFSRCGDVFEKSLVVEVLPLPSRPNISLLQKPVPCTGDSVIIRVQNPQTGIRYFWSTGDSTSSIVVKQSGTYSLDSVSNAFGCGIRVGDTVSVNIKNAIIPPVPDILGPGLVEICEGTKAKLTVDSVQLTVKYKWSNGVVGDSVIVDSGQWTVYSETAEGCQSGSSDTVTVVSVPTPKPVFVNLDSVLTRETLLNQNYCVSGQAGSRFSFAVQGGTIVDSSEDCITVQWIIDNGQWIINATEALDHPDCKGSVSQVFSYMPRLEIPTLITPNADGKNDTFVIQDLEFYPNHHLQIFNRWGRKIMDTNAYKNDWKGDEGIYFYNLMVDGKQTSGWVQVVK